MSVASDIEGTLTTAKTWKALARYLRENGRATQYNRFFYTRFPKALLAQAGFIHKRSFQNQWIKDLIGLFAGYSATEFNSIAEWVVENELWPKRRQDVVNAFLAHQKTGEYGLLREPINRLQKHLRNDYEQKR